MYHNISCHVKVDGLLCEEYLYLIGARQHCVLSPLLFNLFTNDTVDIVMPTYSGMLVRDVFIFILLYAGDIVLVVDNEADLH